LVDRWITLRRWLSGSRNSVHRRKPMEVSPQLSAHGTPGGLQQRNVGDMTGARRGDHEERTIAVAWSADGGSHQRLTGRNSTCSTPGGGPRAATGEADQQKYVESPRPGHRDLQPLGSRTLRHPGKRRGRRSGELSPRSQWKHWNRVAINLGLKLGQMNLRGNNSSKGEVGGSPVQQALPLPTQRQASDQETNPDEKRIFAGG
jgi:hypothetical protein